MNESSHLAPLTPASPSAIRANGPALLLFAAILGGGCWWQGGASILVALLAASAAIALFQWQRNRRLAPLLEGQNRLLAENEALFTSTLDHATAGLALISRDGKWLQVNLAVSRIVGYTPDELMTLDFQTITHPDDLDADLHYVKQILDRKLETYTMDKRYIRKDGSIIWIQLTVAAAWDAAGNLRHFISRIEDINERKLLQERLRESEARGRRTHG